MKLRKVGRYYIASFAAFLTAFIGLAGIAFELYFQRKFPSLGAIISASLFWTGLIAGIVFTVLISRSLKQERRSAVSKNSISHPKTPGVFRFSGKALRIALYCIIAAGILLIAADTVRHLFPGYVTVIMLSVVFLAFTTHCVIDGRDYEVFKTMKEGKKNERA